MAGWTRIDGGDFFEVDRVTETGLYSNYWSGSGRSVAVNVGNLQESVSLSEIQGGGLPSMIAIQNLGNGIHTVQFSNIGAGFSGEEKSPLGGIRVNVTLTAQVDGSTVKILDGTWQQARPDPYNFTPLWSSHRSVMGNIETILGAVVGNVLPPFNPKPFNTYVVGTGQIDVKHSFPSATLVLTGRSSSKPISTIDAEGFAVTTEAATNANGQRVFTTRALDTDGSLASETVRTPIVDVRSLRPVTHIANRRKRPDGGGTRKTVARRYALPVAAAPVRLTPHVKRATLSFILNRF